MDSPPQRYVYTYIHINTINRNNTLVRDPCVYYNIIEYVCVCIIIPVCPVSYFSF